jgi:hypothetical protein
VIVAWDAWADARLDATACAFPELQRRLDEVSGKSADPAPDVLVSDAPLLPPEQLARQVLLAPYIRDAVRCAERSCAAKAVRYAAASQSALPAALLRR